MYTSSFIDNIDPEDFTKVVGLMRSFFLSKGFIEVPTQNRLSILAACEDPQTISTYTIDGVKWPLPQTGQMWLEYELLRNPDWKGCFCVSTSYRDEPNPQEGRHLRIFPMFEFEMHGDMEALKDLEVELLVHLGIVNEERLYEIQDYDELAEHYGVKTLETKHEEEACQDFAHAFFIQNFPNHTSPFWNMKQNDAQTHAKKVDVILYGQETIGSAERSCSVDEMLHHFTTVSNGEYAQVLYDKFGQDRVDAEMKEFLEHDFIPRSGAGIGIPRMIRAYKLAHEC